MKRLEKLSYLYFIILFVFVVVPLFFMFILSFSITNGADLKGIKLTMSNFIKFFSETVYLKAFYNSIKYAFITTTICLVIAFPTSFFLSKIKSNLKYLILILLILPMWSNMILRIIALEALFQPINILNSIGISFDLIGTDFAIVISMVSIYLPFMIFPIFNSLEKLNYSLVEAAEDLGTTKFDVFRKVIVPLSKPGIVSGIIMVFLPAMTDFALPKRISGGNTVLLGNLIERFFIENYDYNMGSLISFILVVIILIMTFLSFKRKGGELYE